MFKGDRTTKILLTVVAIFLGLLVFKSFQSNTAVAQSTGVTIPLYGLQNLNPINSKNSTGSTIGYRTVPVSSINFKPKDKVRSLQVVDSAQSFLVQYDDRIEIYKLDNVIVGTSN